MSNIALLVPTLYYGGSKRSVSNIANILSQQFNTIIIEFDGSQDVYSCNCRIIDINCPAKTNYFSRAINGLRRIYKLNRVLKDLEIDLIISFMDGANNVNYFTNSGAKRIISCRGFGDLLKLEKKYAKMLNKIDGILFNSKEMSDYFFEKYPGFEKKIFTINNVYDNAAFNDYLNEDTEESFDKFVESHKTVAAVGRISKEKGHTHLLKSFNLLKTDIDNAGLVIIGAGPEYENIYEMASNSKYWKDIIFLGYQKNPYKYLKKCDISVLTSINEGFPNVVAESLGCGVPVICTNCRTGPNEILNEQYNYYLHVDNVYLADYGILTPVFSNEINYNYEIIDDKHKIFANAIKIVLTDNLLYKKYKKASYERFLMFTPDRIKDEYFKTIFKMLNA